MAKFRLYASVTVSARTTVEADTLEAAIEVAKGRNVEIAGPNSGYSAFDEWIIEEADGEPQGITLTGAIS